MKKFFLLTLSFALLQGWFSVAFAQEANMSQYSHTPFLTNPGMIGTMERTNIIVNHRNQSVDAGQTYSTSTISAYHPIAVGNHRLGIGASFLSDRVADFMSTNGGLLGTAYSVQLSRRQELSLGVQAGFFNRKLNSSFSYTTDSQFLNGNFSADAPTGEVFVEQSRTSMTLTTGLFWQMKDQEGKQIAYAGGSIFNFNQPNVGFDEESKLPVSMKATAGIRAYQGARFSVVPNLRWLSTANAHMYNAGSWFRYDLSQSIEYPQQISLGAWYNSNKAGVFAFEYDKSSYLVGLSYDIPMVSDLSTMHRGGIFEVALSLRVGNKHQPKLTTQTTVYVPPIVKKPKEKIEARKNIEENTPIKILPPERVEKTASVNRLERNHLTETPATLSVQNHKVQLAERDRLKLNKTVRFELGTHQLTPDSEEFLDEIADIFRRNKALKVELVGHTCSIGTETDNEKLSLQRAMIVQDYMVEKGIEEQRIISKGEGELQPMADNSTEEGRIKNRRVEFQILDEGLQK